MLRKTTTFLLLCALSILSGPSTGKAQDTKPKPDDETSSLLAEDLAAFQAMRSLLASRRYVLTEEQLADMVGKYLRETKNDPPHKFPTVADLEKPLDRDFGAYYEAMIGKATSGLDPKGQLGLEKRLRDYLAQHKAVETAAREQYGKYRDNDLPKIWDVVENQITEQQMTQLTKALAEYVASGKPTAAEIESAEGNAEILELRDNIKKEVLENLKKIDAELHKSRLVGAEEALTISVQKVVSDGLLQLEAQLNNLRETPHSHTVQGITKELQTRLDSFVKQQSTPPKLDPLWRDYGNFPSANARIGKEAETHFGHRVATAANRVMASVKNGSQPLPAEHEEQILKTILGAMALHHRLADSKKQLQPTMDGWVEEERQQWTAQELLQAAKNTPSEYDRADLAQGDYFLDGFRKDMNVITDLLNSGDTDGGKSWKALRDGLAEQYAENLFPKVRARIIQSHARHYSPSLVGGTWRASELEIASFGKLASRLAQEHVYDLHVWATKPSNTKVVLEETWQQWIQSAKRELAIGVTAFDGQIDVVNEVKPQMAGRIRNDPKNNSAYWVNEYTSFVAKKWQDRPSDAARHYPRLFSRTRDEIERVVRELLEIVATEQEEAQEEKVKLPFGTHEGARDLAQSETGELQLSNRSSTRDGNGGEGDVSPGGDGQSNGSSTGDGIDNGGHETPGGADAGIDEQALALIIQNQIVDRLKPDIAADIAIARVTGGNLERSHWIDDYSRRARTMWENEQLAEKFPELCSTVAGKIERFVDGFFMLFQVNMRDRVLLLQMAIVDEHRFGRGGKESILQMIDNDSDATQSEYETLFIDRVLRQWQSDMSEEALHLREQYPDLLSEVKDWIRLIVACSISRKSGGYGDGPGGFYLEFYRIGFWSLLFMLIVVAGCWYWNVRYLRAYIAARRLGD